MLINILLITLILLSILFLFESKSINIILNFIGIIIIIAIIFFNISNNIDFSIISYILIIIYGSALSIIFVFIIMLNKQIVLPNLLLTNNLKLSFSFNNHFIHILLFSIITYFIYYFNFPIFNNISFLEYINFDKVNLLYFYYHILFNSFPIQLFLIVLLLLLALIGIIFITIN